MAVYEHEPHPRIAERKQRGPVKVAEQRLEGGGPISRLNARFGLFVTLAVGTTWCACLFTLLALVSLPAALGTHFKLIIRRLEFDGPGLTLRPPGVAPWMS